MTETLHKKLNKKLINNLMAETLHKTKKINNRKNNLMTETLHKTHKNKIKNAIT